MTDENSLSTASLRGVLSVWFSHAKTLWGLSVIAQIAASLVGAASVVMDFASLRWALGVGIVSAAAWVITWRSEALRQRAESLLRLTEFENGFGWPVDEKVLADSLSSAIPVVATAISREREQGNFFASSTPVGAQRALNNLRESAWWTEQLADLMKWITGIAAVVVAVFAIWALAVVAALLKQPTTPLVVSNVVIAAIVVVFAGNLLRLPFDYSELRARACEAFEKASTLRRLDTVDVADALRVVSEYQLRRALAPLIPDRLWRLRRNRLNEIWNRVNASSSQR